MGLHVDDKEIGEMANQLAELRQVSTIEAVRTALRHELADAQMEVSRRQDFRERIAGLQRRAKEMAGPNQQPITRQWRDGLYEDD